MTTSASDVTTNQVAGCGSTAAPYRLAYLVSHPIQYQDPLLRLIAAQPDFDLTVFFLSDFSLRVFQDEGFGTAVTWDVPLVSGYRYEVLPALGRGATQPPNGKIPVSYGLARRLRAGNFDALWLHGYSHPVNLRAFWEAKRQKIPVMLRCEVWSGAAQGRRSGGAGIIREAFLRRLFASSDAFLAIGSLNAEYYERYGAPKERIHAVPYAVDNAFFQARVRAAEPKREALRASLGLEPGRPIILYSSKFIKRKRAGDLLEAYRKLSSGEKEPYPYLLFVGDGEERGAVEARARSTGWNSIRFLGFRNQTELPAYFDLCDVFVLASEREPWALIVNEVMNAGRAIIVSDEVGAARDLVTDGDNGFVISVGDVTALAARLREVTENPALAKEMGRRSLERINQWGFAEDLQGLRAALAAVTTPRVAKNKP